LSVELPEANILSSQMNRELRGKEVADCNLQECQRLQRTGFVNKKASDFDRLAGARIESVFSRGNVIRVRFDGGMNLILAPEYGGRVLFHAKNAEVSSKYHHRLQFKDNTMLAVVLTGMGVIQALRDEELEGSYVYKRDFSATVSPIGDREFTFERFSKEIAAKNVNIKAVLVGKDAVVVGLSNSSFQDILFRSKIHPKRKASSLNEKEKQALYDAIKSVMEERIRLGGKEQFVDLYGKQGRYTSAMGPNMKGKTCSACGTNIEKLSLGGGQVHFCPICQI
jgi:formamidopyrimidine-DNA glycosylase